MPFKIETMFETVKFYAEKFQKEPLLEKEIKQQLFQKASLEARSARSCCGQIRYMLVNQLLYQFVEGLYEPLNHPVPDIEYFARTLGVSNAAEVADLFQGALDVLETSYSYNPFCRKQVYLLGMAKAAIIEKRGISLNFAADLYKIYYQAFSQVMEIYCDGK